MEVTGLFKSQRVVFPKKSDNQFQITKIVNLLKQKEIQYVYQFRKMSSNNNPKDILGLTKKIYEEVINRVCQKLLDDHEENEGLAEEIIDQLKSVWKRKIEERKVYIAAEQPNNQANEGTQKKEGSTSNQSKQSGSVLQPSSGKNELSDEKTQELLHNVFQQKIVHNHPNPDIQGNTIKKIKTEDNSNYQPPYTASTKLEEISPNFGASDNQDEFDNHRLQHENAQITHHNQKPEASIEAEDFHRQHSHRNIKQEDQEIDFNIAIVLIFIYILHLFSIYLNTINLFSCLLQNRNYSKVKHQTHTINHFQSKKKSNLKQKNTLKKRANNQEDEDSDDDQIDEQEDKRKKENKNELFLLQQDEHKTDCYICGYYSVMKKKTAKKFKISFEKMILSADGKDYILAGLSGDLEW
ncbi:transmembrane protein, putative (macronuclear) [Tetrahymena thermophila SB210]|uniref:Transmembrane protein, putative n=1 Tax=Tetrahymena thermophila (strain SB210) TaxID=312017 RepID=Q22A24_TETTS|nr:transmembrane protein, putative [Tetrahymena thermophila SB210]EAR82155.2 transmembrane protein, putative [Tetrahymena thermophila SB210]|eukprot:XP_001029819.2 transmembrane protein, putative [Tetrahymena thermophila SB210]